MGIQFEEDSNQEDLSFLEKGIDNINLKGIQRLNFKKRITTDIAHGDSSLDSSESGWYFLISLNYLSRLCFKPSELEILFQNNLK